MHTQQKEVAEKNKRKYIKRIATIWFRGKNAMPKQAKTLNAVEIRKVLDYVATRKHSLRNRALVMFMFNTGVRVSECANLRYDQVVDADGNVRSEIRLDANQTKTKDARTIFVNEKLQKELAKYIAVYKPTLNSSKFFYSQKQSSDGFSANTLTQYFHYLYKRVGIDGASSHSSRRSYITKLSSLGVGVRVIMGLSGHKQLSSVQCYIDCNDDQKRAACEFELLSI